MPTTTANLALTLPTPNVDTGWGSTLNTDFTLIDNLFTAAGTGTSVGINVGSGKTLGIGGTLLLGSGDGTGSVTAPTIRGAARTGTNVVGANLTIDAANGTGTGGSGSLIFRTAPATAGGTTPTTMQTRLVIDGTGRINLGPSSMDWAGAGNITMGDTSALGFAGTTGHVGTNTYYNGAWRANTNAPSGLYVQTSGNHLFYNAPAVAAGSAVALAERLRILDTGAVSFGSSGTAYGASGQVLKSNGNTVPTWGNPEIGALAAQTFDPSGNSFYGIPSWAKSITMIVGNMDPSSTSDVLVRLGTPGLGFVGSGYTSSGSSVAATGVSTTNSAIGFLINIGGSVGNGTIRLNAVDGASWVCDHTVGTTTTRTCVGGGLITLPGIDRIQIIPSSGTFAAGGAVRVFYQ